MCCTWAWNRYIHVRSSHESLDTVNWIQFICFSYADVGALQWMLSLFSECCQHVHQGHYGQNTMDRTHQDIRTEHVYVLIRNVGFQASKINHTVGQHMPQFSIPELLLKWIKEPHKTSTMVVKRNKEIREPHNEQDEHDGCQKHIPHLPECDVREYGQPDGTWYDDYQFIDIVTSEWNTSHIVEHMHNHCISHIYILHTSRGQQVSESHLVTCDQCEWWWPSMIYHVQLNKRKMLNLE